MLSSYRELQNTSALLPETEIHVSAFSKLGKLLAAGAFIAFEVTAVVGDESPNVSQGVIEENPDFVGKITVR